MLSERMEKELNKQINAELYSAYLYFSMSAYLQDKGFTGMAKWMEAQTVEEMGHAKKIYDYVYDRGGRVIFEEIKKPQVDWESPLDVFKSALEHERYVSSLINNLVKIAMEENDFMTNNFLQWFVAEQVEEEASVGEIVQKLEMVGNKGNAIFMIDRELGQRQIVLPVNQQM